MSMALSYMPKFFTWGKNLTSAILGENKLSMIYDFDGAKVYENISKDVQDYFSKCQIDSKTYYESDIVWSEYEDWIEQNYN